MQLLPRLLGAISNSVSVEAIVASRRCFEPAQISRNCYVKTLVFKSDAFYACQDVATKSHEKSLEENGPYLQIILSQHDRPRELQRRTVNNATREKDFSTSFLILGWFSSVCVPTYQVPQTPCFVYPLTAHCLTAAPFSVCHILALAHLIEREAGGMSPAR